MPRAAPPRSLSIDEERVVLDVLHSPRFADRAPGEIAATLLDESQFYCSTRTMYRILAKHREVKERRNQLRHRKHAMPQLCATAPNQVWSWDITKLPSVRKYEFYYLYVILDIYSRYVTGWMLAPAENANLASRLFEETLRKYDIAPGQLQAHSDRGSPMTAHGFGQLLCTLGVTQSFSRPRVSNDNCFSEAQFKTYKYAPDYPGEFVSFFEANAYSYKFLNWYNNEHRHSGIGWLTPAMMHTGHASQVYAARKAVLDAAYERNPERFVRHRPVPPQIPTYASINMPAKPVLNFLH